MQELEQEIIDIQKRNKRVEADKAWETSWTRRILVALLTYCVILIFFLVIKTPNPFIAALVPTFGFLLSTLSVSFVKKIWISKFKQIK